MTYGEMLKNRKKNSDLYYQDFTDTKENYCITQYGQKYNLYEHIQNAREDTEIIPTLEKYGMAQGMEKLKRYDPADVSRYYGDFREMTDMRNLLDKSKAAEELWKSLPLDVRTKFGNSQREFYEKGGEWLKSEYEAQIAKQQQMNQPQPQDTGDTNNE